MNRENVVLLIKVLVLVLLVLPAAMYLNASYWDSGKLSYAVISFALGLPTYVLIEWAASKLRKP